MNEDKLKAVVLLGKEMHEIEKTIEHYQKLLNEKKTLIAALKCGFGIGDIVTDGNTTFCVNSFSGQFWKGFRRKVSGAFSENEEYIKGPFKRVNTEPVEILKEP